MLTATSKSPQHVLVANVLKKRIRKGKYIQGENLPTIRVLSAELGVSTNVVQRSLQILEHEGIVQKQHGIGVRVLPSKLDVPLTLGLIYPFSNDTDFAGTIHCFAEQAVDIHKNHCIIKSSSGDPASERLIIKQLKDQGVDGLIVWPCAGTENIVFFEEISREIKIVFIDRSFKDLQIPAVVMDCKGLGADIIHRFGSNGFQNVLILVDPIQISTYEEIYNSMEDTILKIEGKRRFFFHKMETSNFVNEYTSNPFRATDNYYKQLKQVLGLQKFDAMFCPHDEFVDRVYASTNLAKTFPLERVVCITDSKPKPRSMSFYELEPVEWITDFSEMIKQATEILNKMVFLNSKITKQVRIKFFPIIRRNDKVS